MYSKGPVVVMELPEQLSHAHIRSLLRELQPFLESDRPRLVLQCSQVRHMDSAGVEMLLDCMQEAMKGDGDLKLAAVSPAAGAILELMRVDRLFEIFDTEREAVQSFDEFKSYATPPGEPSYSAAYRALGDLKIAS